MCACLQEFLIRFLTLANLATVTRNPMFLQLWGKKCSRQNRYFIAFKYSRQLFGCQNISLVLDCQKCSYSFYGYQNKLNRFMASKQTYSFFSAWKTRTCSGTHLHDFKQFTTSWLSERTSQFTLILQLSTTTNLLINYVVIKQTHW